MWWKEENWPTLKKSLERRRNPAVNKVYDAACLELGEDPVPQMTVANFFQSIGSKPIKFENTSPLRNQTLLLQRQVKYVEDIIFTRDMANLGMSMKEVIKNISDIGQESSYVQSENHLD